MKLISKIYTKVRSLVLFFLPAYAVIPLILCVTWNNIVYYGVRLTYGGRKFYDMTSVIEEHIPVIPASVFIYYLFFPFLALVVLIVSRHSKRGCYQYVLSDFLGKLICLACFLIIPTTNIRPEIVGKDIASQVLRLLYDTDAANNLFPSIHCLDSWYCFTAVRGQEYMPKKYQILILVIAVLICISTLTTKQHVVPDMISGIAIAEVMWFISGKILKQDKWKNKLKLD